MEDETITVPFMDKIFVVTGEPTSLVVNLDCVVSEVAPDTSEPLVVEPADNVIIVRG